MIQIECKGFSLRVNGHAGYAPKGQDIVCAAVTVLCYALGGMLLRAQDEGLLHGAPEVELDDGEIRICCAPKARRPVRMIWDTALLGMEMVANEYPEFVQFERE